MVVGSDIDLLAVLSRNGELNNIADVNELASKHPEMFNALLEAFSTDRRNVNPLTKEGATFKFPSAASDIQHKPQVPFLADKLLQNAAEVNLIKPDKLKQMNPSPVQDSTRAGLIFAALNFFKQDNWPFIQIEGESALETAFTGKNARWDCYAQAI